MELSKGWDYATYRVGLMFQIMDEERANREDTGRNPDGTFKPGVSGNPSGRPKGTMKDYLRRKFMEMTEEEKELFLKMALLSSRKVMGLVLSWIKKR